jgi:putative membrane protein
MVLSISETHGLMNIRSIVVPSLVTITLTVCSVGLAGAADSFSTADKAFVAKVSQGGMYEVALGKLAEMKATTQDVKDSGNTEAHDHTLVGDKLKAIVEGNGMTFPTGLNAEFQARLDKMKALPSDRFDAAYIADMKKIHDADGAAFAKEASSGTNPDLKAFAAETHRIVERHLGELNASVH